MAQVPGLVKEHFSQSWAKMLFGETKSTSETCTNTKRVELWVDPWKATDISKNSLITMKLRRHDTIM